MAKKNNNYFELIKTQTEYCKKASDLLQTVLANFDPAMVCDYREMMHTTEHAADGVRHDILEKLSAEFITPIDREDILLLVQIIDDITDAIDEVVLDIYMYRVDRISQKTVELAAAVSKCVGALYEAMTELKNFKKPGTLRQKLIIVNDIEGEADTIFTEALRELFGSTADAKTLIGSRVIFESLENCCDLCEHAADVIEQVIIKNT